MSETPRTGWPPGLLQDDCRELSRWFATRPDARRIAREVANEIEGDQMNRDHLLGCTQPVDLGEAITRDMRARRWERAIDKGETQQERERRLEVVRFECGNHPGPVDTRPSECDPPVKLEATLADCVVGLVPQGVPLHFHNIPVADSLLPAGLRASIEHLRAECERQKDRIAKQEQALRQGYPRPLGTL